MKITAGVLLNNKNLTLSFFFDAIQEKTLLLAATRFGSDFKFR
jgi:hypothetical protein